jgi:hypothetical protein
MQPRMQPSLDAFPFASRVASQSNQRQEAGTVPVRYKKNRSDPTVLILKRVSRVGFQISFPISYFPRRLKGRSFHGKKRLSMFDLLIPQPFWS